MADYSPPGYPPDQGPGDWRSDGTGNRYWTPQGWSIGPGGYSGPNGSSIAPVSSNGSQAATYNYSTGQWSNGGSGTPGVAGSASAAPAPASASAASAPPNGLTSTQNSAKAQLTADLNAAGFSGADLSSLGDWAWGEFLNGVPETQIFLEMRQRPEYQRRFPAMAQLEAKGHAISEADYINYEKQATQILTYAGLGQFATPDYLTSVIGNEVSLTELQDRIQNGYSKVTEAPPEIRQQFADWFGPNGDAALAGWFLDANHTEPFIKNAVDEAQAGGYAKFFGYNLTQQGAQLIGQIAQTPQSLISGFQQAQKFLPLTYETISEHTDLTQDETAAAAFGVGGPFGVNGTNSQEDFRQRLAERQAAGRGGGGALLSTKGLEGAGTAQQ